MRVRDLETIRAALERFRQERGQYPPIEPTERTLRGASDGCVSAVLGSLVPGILAKIPEDPLGTGGYTQPQAERRCYYYRKGPGIDTYALYARLEGDNSPKPCSKALLYRPEIALYNYCVTQGLVPEARVSAPPEGAAALTVRM